MEWVLAGLLLLLPAVIVVGTLLYSRLACQPQIDQAPPSDSLILAAHPDDCVIMAGEYGAEALRSGRIVRLVYLTCGSLDPNDERARVRRQECLDAWGHVGASPSDLAFIDLPHHDSHSPVVIPETEVARAEGVIFEEISNCVRGCRVFIPADGEMHPDHRLLRRLALSAWRRTGRVDIRVLECPEYNPYLSLARSPVRSLLYLLASIPVISRVVDRYRFSPAPAFFDGPPGLVLPRDPARLGLKKELLRKFTSENTGDILVKYFGFPDQYRVVALDAEAPKAGRWFLKVGERFLSPSLLAVWLSVWAAMLVLPVLLARSGMRWLQESRLAIVATALLGIVLLCIAFVRRKSVEQRLTIALAGMGLIAGGVAAEEYLISFFVEKK